MKRSRAKFQLLWLQNDVINFFSLPYMDILTFRHCDVKMTSYMKFFMNLNSGPKITLFAKFELDQVIILKIIQVSFCLHPKNDVIH